MPVSTPWGSSQDSQKIAHGITFYSTASHGGFRVSKKFNKNIPIQFRNENFDGSGWYEEDCEWAIPFIYNQEVFKKYYDENGEDFNKIYENAVKIIKDYYPSLYENYFGVELKPEESYIKGRKHFYDKHKNDYIVIAAVTEGDYVKCWATIGGLRDRPSKVFLVPKDEYDIGKYGFVIDPNRHKEIEEAA